MMRLNVETDPGRCLRCGSHVTPEFRRANGDQNDRAHRCYTCDTTERIGDGTAAGQESEKVDPLEDPTRFQPTFEDLPEQVKAVCRQVATDGGEIDAE